MSDGWVTGGIGVGRPVARAAQPPCTPPRGGENECGGHNGLCTDGLRENNRAIHGDLGCHAGSD